MKKNNVKKENNNEVQSYSEEDLTQFRTIVNFNNLIFDSVKSETKVDLVTTKYTQTDKKNFQNIINNKFKTSEYVSNNRDKMEKIKKPSKIVNFTAKDEKLFERFNNFSLNLFPNYAPCKKENKKVIFDSVNYSEKDISAFNRILNYKKSSIDNKKEQQELSSKINKSSMKIIDFDKVENSTKNFNIVSNKNIKIKYFD